MTTPETLDVYSCANYCGGVGCPGACLAFVDRREAEEAVLQRFGRRRQGGGARTADPAADEREWPPLLTPS